MGSEQGYALTTLRCNIAWMEAGQASS